MWWESDGKFGRESEVENNFMTFIEVRVSGMNVNYIERREEKKKG